jgi:hypothetical protein
VCDVGRRRITKYAGEPLTLSTTAAAVAAAATTANETSCRQLHHSRARALAERTVQVRRAL